MPWSPDGSTTGAAQTGFTSPTYTLGSDLAPDSNSRQLVVTAVGGTQAGVRTSAAGDPFTLLIRKDRSYKTLPSRNPATGAYSGSIPKNKIEILGRKGVYIDADQNIQVAHLRLIAELPAGCEVRDPANVRALVSMVLGTLAEESADYGDSLITGVI
jgi:hypothetical protein